MTGVQTCVLPIYDHVEAVAKTGHEFAALSRRADGEPILRGRLRLAMPAGSRTTPANRPDDSFDDEPDLDDLEHTERTSQATWSLGYEIVDIDDRSRWCTGDDVLQGTPAAADLARDPRFRFTLRQQFSNDLTAIAKAVPELAEWATARLDGSTHGHRIPVDLAAALLESLDSLNIIGVELVAPERLVRKSPSTRAIVTPLPSGGQGVTGRLAAGALVAWQPTIDNTPITEEQLAKAALQGATLIQVGGRWVQVDRAEAKRALANLHTQRQREVVSPLELLKLAAELEAELAAQQARSGIAGIDDIPAPTDEIGRAHV
mgnify:CR=1 FL=1